MIQKFSCGEHVKIKTKESGSWEPAIITYGNSGIEENETCLVLLQSGKKIEVPIQRILF